MFFKHLQTILFGITFSLSDFLQSYVRDAVTSIDNEEGDAFDSDGNPQYTSGDHEDASDDLVRDMDALMTSISWRSKNYRLISEYSNSMSLSDSSVEQLLKLVSQMRALFRALIIDDCRWRHLTKVNHFPHHWLCYDKRSCRFIQAPH